MELTESKKYRLAFLTTVIALLLVRKTDAGKVLVMSMQFGSHLNEFAQICKGLLKLGHTIHVVADENLRNPSQFKGMEVEFLYYKSPNREMVDPKLFDERTVNYSLVAKYDEMAISKLLDIPRFTYDCNMLLHDNELVKRLENEKYDIALADVLIQCYHVMAHKLNVPVVSVGTIHCSWYAKTHPLVNLFSPCSITKETNTFFNRLMTLWEVFYLEKTAIPNMFIDKTQFMNYVPERPYESLEELVMKSTLFIYNRNGVIDCATPTMPNLIQVGGLTTHPPKPLTPDYESYAKNAKDGIIIASFGSGIAYLPKDMFLKFLIAFKQLKQKVIWRNSKTYGEKIPTNVKMVEWMPQNDLMAHPNTKLFITHGGGNGQSEAVLHGVPMLSCPLWADQASNAKRAIHKGFGLAMDIHDFTSDEMVRKINELVNNPKYSKAITKASKVFRSLPDPRDTAAFWVDHVMQNGADHLTTTLSDMTFIQFFMIDIYLFVSLVIVIICFGLKKALTSLKGRLDSSVENGKKRN